MQISTTRLMNFMKDSFFEISIMFILSEKQLKVYCLELKFVVIQNWRYRINEFDRLYRIKKTHVLYACKIGCLLWNETYCPILKFDKIECNVTSNFYSLSLPRLVDKLWNVCPKSCNVIHVILQGHDSRPYLHNYIWIR